MTRGKVKRALLAALVLVALAGLALVISFDAPDVGRDVSNAVRSATGIELQIGRSRFRLFQDLILDDVSFSAGSSRGRFPRIVLERGRELEGIQIDEGRIDFDGGAVVVEGLELALTRLDTDPRAVTKLHGLSLEGDLSLRSISVDHRAVRKVTARISTSNGRFQIQELGLTTSRGELSGELALDFNSIPFRYRAALLGSSIEVKGFGRGRLRLDVEGFGTKARNLKGNGTFALERGRLPDASWVREIDPALVGAEHGSVESLFEVREERVYLERFEIETEERVLALEGSFGFDGARDIRPSLARRRSEN